jgi:predicted DNA-binding antitoxin AbrB/MazE fold protein
VTKTIEAIYEDGVLTPLEPLELPERQRVRVTVEPVATITQDDRAAARRALVDRLKRSTLSYGGPLPTRDELHER